MNNNYLADVNSNIPQRPSISKFRSNYEPKKTLGSKMTAALAIAMVSLPVLSVGIANYYFDRHGVNKQEIRAKEENTSEITENQLATRNLTLTIVLLSTGTTALIVGILTAFWTIRITRWNERQAEQEAQKRKEQKRQLFQEFIQYFSQPLDISEILEATVEETQKILECDRVIIYSLSQNNYGKIIAEAVTPGKPRAKGQILADPTFELKKITTEDSKDFWAFEDINFAKLPSPYITQLEQLGVKANLVVPIGYNQKFFAILAAHHCTYPYHWQVEEQQFLSELATRVGFALNNARILADATKTLRQTKTEEYWTQLSNETIKHLGQSSTEEDILNIAVEKVRQAIKADRVVIYSLDRDNLGSVVAESVASGWSRTLGITIEDPCFASRYIQAYSEGRVKAIDNLQEAKLSECYLEQLEQLEVKANLVAPIIDNERIFGLLILHQCSAPRTWQEHEIKWVTQIAKGVGLAIGNAKLLKDKQNLLKQLETEAEWTKLYSDTVEYILESLQEKDILQVTVEQVRQVLKCDRVLVYSLDPESYGMAIEESVAAGWTRAIGQIFDDPCFAIEYIKKYSNGRVQATDNIYEAKLSECYIAQLERLEVKANLVTPILYKQKLFGLLIAHQCSAPRSWQPQEIRWLAQVAKQVGSALSNAKILQQSQQPIVIAPSETEKLPVEIIPITTSSLEIDEDLAVVQAKLAETMAKIQQINDTSQKLLQVEDSINDKFKQN